MLQISYRLTLACPVYVILSQYYDYEHIATVHPNTLGEYKLVEVRDEGRDILYDHLWPARPGRPRPVSRVRHRYFPPLAMEFEFLSGRHRGTRVRTLLAPQGRDWTLIDETYFLPGLPNWRWLAAWIKPLVMRPVHAIWKEDLDVGVCIDGWPGVPAGARAEVERQELPVASEPLPARLAASDIPEGEGRCYDIAGQAVAVFNANDRLRAVANRCPHTGGPLALGRLTADRECVGCPWHGARFNLATGEQTADPGRASVEVIRL